MYRTQCFVSSHTSDKPKESSRRKQHAQFSPTANSLEINYSSLKNQHTAHSLGVSPLRLHHTRRTPHRRPRHKLCLACVSTAPAFLVSAIYSNNVECMTIEFDNPLDHSVGTLSGYTPMQTNCPNRHSTHRDRVGKCKGACAAIAWYCSTIWQCGRRTPDVLTESCV